MFRKRIIDTKYIDINGIPKQLNIVKLSNGEDIKTVSVNSSDIFTADEIKKIISSPSVSNPGMPANVVTAVDSIQYTADSVAINGKSTKLSNDTYSDPVSWSAPITIQAATTKQAGIMSKDDKVKLDNLILENSYNYVLTKDANDNISFQSKHDSKELWDLAEDAIVLYREIYANGQYANFTAYVIAPSETVNNKHTSYLGYTVNVGSSNTIRTIKLTIEDYDSIYSENTESVDFDGLGHIPLNIFKFSYCPTLIIETDTSNPNSLLNIITYEDNQYDKPLSFYNIGNSVFVVRFINNDRNVMDRPDVYGMFTLISKTLDTPNTENYTYVLTRTVTDSQDQTSVKIQKLTVSPYKNTYTLESISVTTDWSNITNKPTIPAAQQQVDWNAETGITSIKNKPTIPADQSKAVADLQARIATLENTVKTLTDNGALTQIKQLTVDEYSALTTKDPKVMYVVKPNS